MGQIGACVAGNESLKDPIHRLLLWAFATETDLSDELIESCNIDPQSYLDYVEFHEEDILAMRKLRLIGNVMTSCELGRLMRARYACVLVNAQSANEIEKLVRAATMMPAWFFPEPLRPESGMEEVRVTADEADGQGRCCVPKRGLIQDGASANDRGADTAAGAKRPAAERGGISKASSPSNGDGPANNPTPSKGQDSSTDNPHRSHPPIT